MVGRAFGNYVAREKLGEGGMGAVYIAEHPQLRKRAAVKVLRPELVAHIVEIFDFGQLDDGSSYITMEWLDGRSLAEVLRDAGRLPLDRAAHIVDGIARALAAAHAHGIVHRDLKPDNIVLVSRDGDADFVKVLDFGIAKLMDGDSGVKTQTGAILGTPYYMAPEQCNGAAVDARTDIYALGVVAYQMLTGRLPFERGGLAELLVAHLSEAPPRPRSITSDVPPHIEAALLQALEKDPNARFQSPTAFANALRSPSTVAMVASALRPSPIAAVPTPAPGRRSRIMTLAAGASVAVLMAVLGATMLCSRPTQPTAAATQPHDEPGKGPAAPEKNEPAGPAKSSSSVATWLLARSSCGPGAMPAKVVVSQTGEKITITQPGFPDARGTIDAQGRYTVRNALGTCHGQVSGKTSTETCSNALGSCRATYRARD